MYVTLNSFRFDGCFYIRSINNFYCFKQKPNHSGHPTMSKPAYTFESSDSDDDSSAAPERDLKYAMSFRIKYGKAYKGKCLQDVVATPRGRKYLKWSLDEFDNLHPAAK